MQKTAVRSISLVALLTVTAKALGMLRDILQARAFGAGAQMDAYTSASNFTVYIFSACAYALCIAAVAVVGRKLPCGRPAAQAAADRLISVCLCAACAVAAVLVLLGAFGVFGSALSPYMVILSLSLPVIVLTYMFMAYFQVLGHYSVQGSLSLLYNIALCLVLFVWGGRMSVPVFAACMSGAWLLQLATLVPCFAKERYRFRFSLNADRGELGTFLKTAAATLFTTSAFLLCYLCDSAQSAFMGEGVVTAFSYADKLFTPLVTTIIYSISAVMFPRWSEKSRTLEPEQYRRYVLRAVVNTVMFMLPVSAVVAAFGVPVVRVLFEGGSFSLQSATLAGQVFSCYALGMVGFALLDLVSKAFYAQDRIKTPLIVNLSAFAVNLLLNWFVSSLGWGAPAVAACTALVLTAAGAVMTCLFAKGIKGEPMLSLIVKSAVLSGVMFIVLHLLSGTVTNPTDGKIMLIVKCAAPGIAAAAVYILLMWKHIRKTVKEGEK